MKKRVRMSALLQLRLEAGINLNDVNFKRPISCPFVCMNAPTGPGHKMY